MSEVQIHTTRLDPTANEPLMAIANAGAAAFGYTADLTLDGQLAQLLRLRVAQINNCAYCLNVHYAAARDVGIPQVKIDCLTGWWETRLFSEAERAHWSTPKPSLAPATPRSRRHSSSTTTN